MNELADLLGLDPADPEQALALDLVKADHDMLRDLVWLRRKAHMRQEDVGAKFGVTQPTVQAFERVGNDPRLSSIRRYALAIGARITHKVERDSRLERIMLRARDLSEEHDVVEQLARAELSRA
jgi:transcriptional regulator with XRE-family HTH domain